MNCGVKLEGHQFDLLDWYEELKRPFDPYVDKVTLRDGAEAYVLFSVNLSDGEPGDVNRDGKDLVSRLNGAMAMARGSEPLSVGGVVCIAPDNTVLQHYVLAAGTARMRSRGSAVSMTVTGRPAPPPKETKAQAWLRTSDPSPGAGQKGLDRADLVADMLTFVGRADNWFDLYKAIECAAQLAGGEAKLLRLSGSEGPALKNAKATANHHRHARAHRPPKPATFQEAHRLMRFAAELVLSPADYSEKAVG